MQAVFKPNKLHAATIWWSMKVADKYLILFRFKCLNSLHLAKNQPASTNLSTLPTKFMEFFETL